MDFYVVYHPTETTQLTTCSFLKLYSLPNISTTRVIKDRNLDQFVNGQHFRMQDIASKTRALPLINLLLY
jgi:hypothetical protein